VPQDAAIEESIGKKKTTKNKQTNNNNKNPHFLPHKNGIFGANLQS